MNCVIPKRENAETMLLNPPSPKLIIGTRRSRCKVIIILAFALILITHVIYGKIDKQTSTTGPSESFSQHLTTTKAASETFPADLHTTTADLSQEEYNDSEIIDTAFFENSRDVKDQPITMGLYGYDIPFLWSIPKSGTSTIKGILSECLNLRIAGSSSQIDYDSYDQIQVVNGGLGGDNSKGGHFVNVNFGYLPGILKAQEWKMVESGLVDVAITSYIHEGITEAFDHIHPARIFTVLRHPILRMISLFNHHKDATWDKDINPTLLEYASDSQYHVDNWMTRALSNRHSGPVRNQDYLYAKRVLKEKVLILLLDEIDESMERLVTFMDWGRRLGPPQPPSDSVDLGGGLSGGECLESHLHFNPVDAHDNDHSSVVRNSEEWQMLEYISNYDIGLYWYGKELFDGEQKKLYNNLMLE